ncbi:hypothetical protein ADUPG1_001157 [Aduncisulcus paluster]|uniref:RGS domain-containing protein n=1 Tax=Aduncisulcus paluster TaxID=2918883 RepID=A0ABQ5KA97_9EUKA|nr:hypothetical protein ADUPG1_001157 [Aduncisulcus paluster]
MIAAVCMIGIKGAEYSYSVDEIAITPRLITLGDVFYNRSSDDLSYDISLVETVGTRPRRKEVFFSAEAVTKMFYSTLDYYHCPFLDESLLPSIDWIPTEGYEDLPRDHPGYLSEYVSDKRCLSEKMTFGSAFFSTFYAAIALYNNATSPIVELIQSYGSVSAVPILDECVESTQILAADIQYQSYIKNLHDVVIPTITEIVLGRGGYGQTFTLRFIVIYALSSSVSLIILSFSLYFCAFRPISLYFDKLEVYMSLLFYLTHSTTKNIYSTICQRAKAIDIRVTNDVSDQTRSEAASDLISEGGMSVVSSIRTITATSLSLDGMDKCAPSDIDDMSDSFVEFNNPILSIITNASKSSSSNNKGAIQSDNQDIHETRISQGPIPDLKPSFKSTPDPYLGVKKDDISLVMDSVSRPDGFVSFVSSASRSYSNQSDISMKGQIDRHVDLKKKGEEEKIKSMVASCLKHSSSSSDISSFHSSLHNISNGDFQKGLKHGEKDPKIDIRSNRVHPLNKQNDNNAYDACRSTTGNTFTEITSTSARSSDASPKIQQRWKTMISVLSQVKGPALGIVILLFVFIVISFIVGLASFLQIRKVSADFHIVDSLKWGIQAVYYDVCRLVSSEVGQLSYYHATQTRQKRREELDLSLSGIQDIYYTFFTSDSKGIAARYPSIHNVIFEPQCLLLSSRETCGENTNILANAMERFLTNAILLLSQEEVTVFYDSFKNVNGTDRNLLVGGFELVQTVLFEESRRSFNLLTFFIISFFIISIVFPISFFLCLKYGKIKESLGQRELLFTTWSMIPINSVPIDVFEGNDILLLLLFIKHLNLKQLRQNE